MLINTLLKISHNFLSFCLTLFYPTVCRQCSIVIPTQYILCSSCFPLLKRCSSLALPITSTKKCTVVALSAYQGVIRQLILKKHSRNFYASYDLANLWIATLSLDAKSIDCLMPIPLHWMRHMQRTFNQAELIAKTLGKQYSIPVVNALGRIRKTQYQSTLLPHDRETNIKNCFVIKKKWKGSFKNKRIVLVDDLCTTGATLKEAAKVLYKAGAQSVNACVMARTI